MNGLRLSVSVEAWPLRNAFVIARGAKTEARVVVAELRDGSHAGRGECVPYARYGETVEGVAEQIRAAGPIADRERLRDLLAPGAARNALDCALWDLEARRTGRSAASLAGLPPLKRVETCFTLSLDGPEAMAAAAARVPELGLLKLKLGGSGDIERMRAVRAARPDARLVADANEAWQPHMLAEYLGEAASQGFELIEQPLPAGEDAALASLPHAVPICADESVHTRAGLDALRGRYDAINIKLDKAGGLTEALDLQKQARSLDFKIMVGCMVATSLAMAPALLVAQDAEWVDLDGPLLLARDRVPGLSIEAGRILPAEPGLWG
jgi:L-alanine-DL-glutamate epimerase-like enolase superfamily enzyme